MRVLVTYVSPHGSTRGIAERIATRLRDSGLSADCLPVHETPAVAEYDAVVVGSAIHNQAWLLEASQFLSTHAAELVLKPVWLYSVGMPGALAVMPRDVVQSADRRVASDCAVGSMMIVEVQPVGQCVSALGL